MNVTPTEIKRVLDLLVETPRRIRSASGSLANARLHSHSDEPAWSANDILAHLRSCADVWGKTIHAMLAKDNPTLPYVSPRSWIRKTDYPELAFRASFQAFAQQRDELLNTLKSLGIEEWSRAALIKGREHTVFSQARRMALHETEHCQQIEALLK